MASSDRRPEALDFRRAIICALPREFDAVEALFDEHYHSIPTEKHHGDPNFYRTGRIGTDYVVLTCLEEMGKGSAASAASTLRISFPNIDFALVVGICGGVPFPTENTELIMGDVIISHQVVTFDFGRQYPDRFEQKGAVLDTLDRSNRGVRSVLSGLRTRREQERFQELHSRYLRSLEGTNPIWRYPGVDRDRLFSSSSRHVESSGRTSNTDCDSVGCQGELIHRSRLTTHEPPRPLVHLGSIASGDTVMKSADHRDQLARKSGIVGFEMEGAGVCNSLSCLILKGACDYADSHKNKVWQDYAAASAAACTKALLECLVEQISEFGAYIYSHTLEAHTGKISASIVSHSTSDIYDCKQHIRSIEQGLQRLGGGIPNAMMRRALIPAAREVIGRDRSEVRNLQNRRFLESKPRRTMFGTIRFQTQITKHMVIMGDKETNRTETKTSFIFHPAPWLMRLGLRYGLKAMAINHHRTWRYTIQPVHTVPDDSLIFLFCRTGNVDAVRQLLARGDASVFDIDSDGLTPLHTAACAGNIELARLLISEGADKKANSYGLTTPTAILRCREDTVRPFDLLSLFEDCIEFWDNESDGWDLLSIFDDIYPKPKPQVSLECLSLLLRKYRAEGTGTTCSTYVWDALVRAYIKQDDISIEMFLQFDPNLESYYHSSWDDSMSAALRAMMFYLHEHSAIRQHFIDRGVDLIAQFGGETPASRAMRFACVFLAWRREVIDNAPAYNIDFVIQQETAENSPLALQGWTSDTLYYMFYIGAPVWLKNAYRGEYPEFDDVSCLEGGCSAYEPAHRLHDDRAIVEPWWEELKHRIKTQKCVCSMRRLVTDNRPSQYFTHTSDCRERNRISTSNSTTEDSRSEPLDENGGNASSNAITEITRHGPFAEVTSRFEYYYAKYGGLYCAYGPQEYYCFPCLAEREGWELECTVPYGHGSDTSGGFVIDADEDSQTEEEPDPGDFPGLRDGSKYSKRGEKRKWKDTTHGGLDQLRLKRVRG